MDRTGFGVTELANKAGVSRSQIQRICNGMAPRMDTQAKLLAALKTKSAPRSRKSPSPAVEAAA